MINISVKNKVMLNVYAIYCMRKLKSPFIIESFAMTCVAILLFYFVSIPSIVSNMIHSGNLYYYFVMAFSQTDILVQSTLVFAGAIMVFSLRNFSNILKLSRSNSVGRVTPS